MEPDSGEFKWGVTITMLTSQMIIQNFLMIVTLSLSRLAYDNIQKKNLKAILRGFLGRMLFSGEEALKEANVLIWRRKG